MKTVIFMVAVVTSLSALKQKRTSWCLAFSRSVALLTTSSSIDKFLLEAGNAEQFDGNASVDQALEKLGLQSQYGLLPGMEVALMPHQTIGVAWMLDKEQSSLKGGCLGDDMGLGKVRDLSTGLTVLFHTFHL
jgi:SNF2 family DNA or RNA helicase